MSSNFQGMKFLLKALRQDFRISGLLVCNTYSHICIIHTCDYMKQGSSEDNRQYGMIDENKFDQQMTIGSIA